MPPKNKVSREEILAAACALLETGGKDAVTSRAIAEKLGVSSRPIYSFFPSMEELLLALSGVVMGMLKEYMSRETTSDRFLNMGVGYVLFYQEKPLVAEFMEKSDFVLSIGASNRAMLEGLYAKLKDDNRYEEISWDDFCDIYDKTTVYSFGLVNFLRSRNITMTVPEIISTLHEAGEAFIVHCIWKNRGRPSGLK
jgi:AcrR family transcriptional regulator